MILEPNLITPLAGTLLFPLYKQLIITTVDDGNTKKSALADGWNHTGRVPTAHKETLPPVPQADIKSVESSQSSLLAGHFEEGTQWLGK
jgi:hypothetical protein